MVSSSDNLLSLVSEVNKFLHFCLVGTSMTKLLPVGAIPAA